MTTRKKVQVKIFGNEYTILGEHSEEFIKGLANKIDKMMKEISSKNNRYNSTMIAVLAALNLAYEFDKKDRDYESLNEEHEKMKAEYEIPIEQLNCLNMDMEALREHYREIQEEYSKTQIEMSKLNKETNLYKEEIKDLKCELDVSKNTIKELQNKLFENQIELLKTKKELESLKPTKEKFNK